MIASMEPRASEVLDFWFAGSTAPRAEWFRKDAAFDAQIAQRFGALIEQALARGLAPWTHQPSTALAQVIVLDQFTRNVFRDTPRAFAGDALALPALHRLFVYLPFEHAEDRATQQESLRLFAALTAAEGSTASFEDYAQRHAEVIERFGRFPHRNDILGRDSTAEELLFLQQPGSRF